MKYNIKWLMATSEGEADAIASIAGALKCSFKEAGLVYSFLA